MSDITKVREWLDLDGTEVQHEGVYEWPAPPSNVESLVTGDLRAHILAKIGREPDDGARVTIVERDVEGGYSEWTVEMDYEIEVWVTEGTQSQRVFETYGYDQDSRMARFLEWATPSTTGGDRG